ncbi:MAG: hypothetical protein HY660_05420 [Armatimonadetes bacterium]|nr:hypothetical protein [Armatimonadota bacterium]
MCGTGVCPKCGGDRRVVRGMLLREPEGGVPAGAVDVANAVRVNAFVCMRCGFTEFYTLPDTLRPAR